MIHNISHCASADDSKTMLIHNELKGRYANIAFEYKYCDLLQPDLNFPSTIRSKKSNNRSTSPLPSHINIH